MEGKFKQFDKPVVIRFKLYSTVEPLKSKTCNQNKLEEGVEGYE